ncbi:MAG: citrate synthase [Myxococcaceae bacterium]|nr:citrate synthase [Myxococcaceae bacterium]
MTIQATDNDLTVHEGLDGVVVTRTRLSHVDGQHGRLIVAGFDVEDLVQGNDFESACAVLFSAAGEPSTREQVAALLERGRARAFASLSQLGDALSRADAMDALRAGIAHLPETAGREDIIAAAAVYTAAHARGRAGKPPLAPPAGARHAEALLAMLGLSADPARARALDAYLVTVMDHGLNASTFAARVVASTRSDLVSALVAGVGALKGPLHGGAPGPVLEMLDAIGSSEQAAPYLTRELEQGRRIMGMGHRIYRQRDPRAVVLERALETLESELRSGAPADSLASARLTLARTVERAAEVLLEARYPGRNLRANVEFYTAVLLSALELPSELFAAVFACARSAGWAAHVMEQRAHGRLIRPSAQYVGAQPQ